MASPRQAPPDANMSVDEKLAKLSAFSQWVKEHTIGDEKGEAQIFLDRLFIAFGWPGLKEAGASCEQRIKNTTGGTSFADLVWKPVVVIEMKKRGADLSKHYTQAFTYWTRLVPNRPRYAVLCNFDEFWIYDFDNQLDTPVDVVKVTELASRFGPLSFLFPGDITPVFGNHQETVTRLAADKLANCFNALVNRGIDMGRAQRFILQMLMSLFAEDIGLLDPYFVTKLLDECDSPQRSYDLINGLFQAMNSAKAATGGRFKGVPYFNGGLFAEPSPIELEHEEVLLLREAANFDWSKVRPEIFGTIFEHSLGKEARHATGAHFTSPSDIMKVVGPTIVAPWSAMIEGADTLTRLQTLLAAIENFTVADVACGSGNFLYVSYRELKRLEARIYERMETEYKSVDSKQRAFGFLSGRNFYGMDINPFAVAIAKVTMMLAHKLSIDELHINEEALPLDNLDANFAIGDALVNPDGTRTVWPKVDCYVGNPPFLGSKLLKPAYGEQYVKKLRAAYPEVPGMADFCVYWFRRAHDELPACTPANPAVGRAGLVGTQNIRSNASREGGLDYIVQSGCIVDAVENQPWSGEANVSVSIVNWVKTQDPKLLPKRRALWFKVEPTAPVKRRTKGSGSATKSYDLDMRQVEFINSALSDKADVATAAVLKANEGAVVCQGITPGHLSFLLSEAEHVKMLAADKKSEAVMHPYLTGDDILSESGSPSRWLIDFDQMNIMQASAFTPCFNHLRATVLPAMEAVAEKATSERETSIARWWLHWRVRSELKAAIAAIPRYLVCSRVTKRPIFAFVSSSVRPGDAVQAFALADDYSFGILQSAPHWFWFIAKSSKLTERLRYTPESVFNTFPWPQAPTWKQIDAIAAAGRKIRRIRHEHTGGMRVQYRTMDLPGKNPLRDAHAALDKAVLDAYGFSPKGDLLQQLLDLNMAMAADEANGVPIVGAGIPVSFADRQAELMSDDSLA